MPIYGLARKESQTSLEVLQAIGLLTNFDLPRKVESGSRVYANCAILNNGFETLQYFARIYDRDTGTIVAESLSDYINAGATGWFNNVDLGLMPAKDWKLRAVAVHRDEYGGLWEGTSLDGSVYRWIIIPTVLTITVTPSVVGRGESYKASGKLTVQDTYSPSNRSIKIYRGTALEKTVTTDSTGNYDSGALTAPLQPALYTIKAVFEGVDEEAVVLSPSMAESFLGVDLSTIPNMLGIVAIVAGTAGLLFAKVR